MLQQWNICVINTENFVERLVNNECNLNALLVRNSCFTWDCTFQDGSAESTCIVNIYYIRFVHISFPLPI